MDPNKESAEVKRLEQELNRLMDQRTHLTDDLSKLATKESTERRDLEEKYKQRIDNLQKEKESEMNRFNQQIEREKRQIAEKSAGVDRDIQRVQDQIKREQSR